MEAFFVDNIVLSNKANPYAVKILLDKFKPFVIHDGMTSTMFFTKSVPK